MEIVQHDGTEKRYQIVLDEEEMRMLIMLCGNIGGGGARLTPIRDAITSPIFHWGCERNLYDRTNYIGAIFPPL